MNERVQFSPINILYPHLLSCVIEDFIFFIDLWTCNRMCISQMLIELIFALIILLYSKTNASSAVTFKDLSTGHIIGETFLIGGFFFSY